MRLVIVDGLDGVGKDTHALLIKNYYENKGEKVLIRSHPTSDNFFGRQSKKALLGRGKINKVRASFFYMMDVLRSIKRYYLKSDVDTLIMVRYLLGTAYLPRKLSRYAYTFFENFVPGSSYRFFLDASPKELLSRVSKREEKEMFETLEGFSRVRVKALDLVKDWYIIDTSGSIEESFAKIERILRKLG